MAFIGTTDGVELYYKDWGTGRPVVFSHGWPLNSDCWDRQMSVVADAGMRAIAYDRRGHGRSTQTWSGHDMDTYAADLAALLDQLDLRDAILVGHSAGSGDVVRCVARQGTARVARVVLLGAVTPAVRRSDHHPDGIAAEIFDHIEHAVFTDRAQFFRELAHTVYDTGDGVQASGAMMDAFWAQSMLVGMPAALGSLRAFSTADFTADLSTIDIPVLVVHGASDQLVPCTLSAPRTVDLLTDGRLSIHPGAPHCLVGAFEDAFDTELIEFAREGNAWA